MVFVRVVESRNGFGKSRVHLQLCLGAAFLIIVAADYLFLKQITDFGSLLLQVVFLIVGQFLAQQLKLIVNRFVVLLKFDSLLKVGNDFLALKGVIAALVSQEIGKIGVIVVGDAELFRLAD